MIAFNISALIKGKRMKFNIKPYSGIEIINFKMSRTEIHSILKSTSSFEEFYRTNQSKMPSDIFKDLGLIINYDENSLCDAIEFFSPTEIFFDRIDLLNMSYKGIFSYFTKNDDEIEEDDFGFISYKYGIGIYAPNKVNDPLEKIESIIAFRKGYYS